MKDFRTLNVWEKGHRVTLAVYKAPAKFPREGLYGLTSQIRRSSSSIPASIAEGCGRNGDTELARFLGIARGSASELDLLEAAEYKGLTGEVIEVKRMLTSFIQKPKAEG